MIRGIIENEEKFARKFSELGDMTLDVRDYDNPQAINSLILELGKYKQTADEYENETYAYLESHLGKRPDTDHSEPYSVDEKMAKLHTLLDSMRRFADISIETYGYLLSIQDDIEFDEDGNPVIESDEKREHFNTLIDGQASAAYDFDDEARNFEAYSEEYLERLKR